MKPERWQQLEELFRSALERGADERSDFLAQACAGDEEARREVESLIVAHVKAEGFIETPAFEIAAEAFADEQSRLLVGQNVGHYRILEWLGEGGMGEVYLAEDMTLGRRVALKLLPADFTRDQDRVRRFKQEARAASALNHENVCVIHEIAESEEGHLFIVMEYLEGQTLDERIGGLPLETTETISIGIQIAEALAEAHARRMIHRDIKPANVMITPRERVKVLDFGIVKIEQPLTGNPDSAITLPQPKTETGMLMGTLEYLSPEQARGEAVDQRTDIWSLGVVLYEMATGTQPFKGNTPALVFDAILHHTPTPPRRLNLQLPIELEQIINKTLEKNRDLRYETAADLGAELKRLKRDTRAQQTDTFSTTARPAASRSWQQTRSFVEHLTATISLHKKGAVAAVLATIVVVVAAIAYRTGKSLDGTGKRFNSVAILPLVNASADPNADYLSDGITESIINSLSQLPQLHVMARTTIFRYKGQQVDPQKVGHELGVDAVLTGKLAQIGDTLIIQAELVDVADGSQLWGEKYNRKASDVFAIQDEIAGEISDKLQLRLTTEQKKRLTKRYTENTEAYQLYLKGRYNLGKYNEEGFKKGLDFFKQAIDIDPTYALAYAGMADAYYWLSNLYLPPKEAMEKSRAAALKALEIDEMLAEAHVSLAVVKFRYYWDWSGGEKEFKRAIELNANYATAHHMYGYCLVEIGRTEEALLELKKAQELDPLSSSITQTAVMPYYFASPPARQLDHAIEELRKIIAADPNFFPAHGLIGQVYEKKGKAEMAISEFTEMQRLGGGVNSLGYLGHAYAMAGERKEVQNVLREMRERSKREYVAPSSFARVYVGLGDKDQTFEWLDKAYEARDEEIIVIKVHPMFDDLHSDPRFAVLLRRMNL